MTEWTMPANLKILFKSIAAGDVAAYSELYRTYHAQLFAVVMVYTKNRELADDTLQEIFLKIWERRAELININDPAAWLNTAARYQIKNALYKEFSQSEFLKRLELHTQSAAPDIDSIAGAQQKELIEKTVKMLPPQQLKVYRLSREEGLSYSEIAAQLKVGRETVKEHMARALRFLHTTLSRQKDLLFMVIYYFFKN